MIKPPPAGHHYEYSTEPLIIHPWGESGGYIYSGLERLPDGTYSQTVNRDPVLWGRIAETIPPLIAKQMKPRQGMPQVAAIRQQAIEAEADGGWGAFTRN